MTTYKVWMPIESDKPVVTTEKNCWQGLIALPNTIIAFDDVSLQDDEASIHIEIDDEKHSFCEALEVELDEAAAPGHLLAVIEDLKWRMGNLNEYLVQQNESVRKEKYKVITLEKELRESVKEANFWYGNYSDLKRELFNQNTVIQELRRDVENAGKLIETLKGQSK